MVLKDPQWKRQKIGMVAAMASYFRNRSCDVPKESDEFLQKQLHDNILAKKHFGSGTSIWKLAWRM